MSIFDTDVAIRKTLEDFCNQREGVVRLYKDAHHAMKMTDQAMREVYSYGLPGFIHDPVYVQERMIKDIDRIFWRISFEHTGFMQLLDAEARKKFDEDISNNPPEFTIGNVQSTFLSLLQDAYAMFNRGVVNVFRRLSAASFKTNDIFKIGEKVVMTYMIEPRWKRGLQIRHGRADDEINDIDRVFKVLDGKRHNPRELSCAMNTAFENGTKYEDAYFQARAFKNGNLHLRFKRADLLERANLLIAKHYGGDSISKGARP